MYIIIFACIAVCQGGILPKVKIVQAAYMQKIPDAVLYQGHAKVIFKVKLPEFHPLQGNNAYWNKPQEAGLNAELYVRMLYQDYVSEMGILSNLTFQSKRPKRQILVGVAALATGYFVHSVFSKIAPGLFGTEDHITEYVNQLQTSVKEEDQRYYVLQQDINNYAASMNRFQKHMVNRVQQHLGYYATRTDNKLAELYRLLLVKIDHDQIIHSIDMCKRKEFPSKLITSQEFTKSLKTLSSNQAPAGKELAIPLTDISQYLKLPIFDCLFSEKFVTVIASIPLKTKYQNWNLYKIFHHKFAYLNQTCQLYPTQPSFLATSNSKSVLITSHLLHDCPITKHKMCLIPEYSLDSSESLECAVGILNGKSTSQLSKICAFRCSSNTELSISQIDGNRLIVTNANAIEISCQGKVNAYQFDKLGAIELNLDCKCNATIDGTYSVRPFYCINDGENANDDAIYRTVPTLWSELPRSFSKHEMIFQNLSNQTFNENWINEIPVLNLSLKSVNIPDKITVFQDQNVFIWLSVLTGFNLVVAVFCFCICRAVFVR